MIKKTGCVSLFALGYCNPAAAQAGPGLFYLFFGLPYALVVYVLVSALLIVQSITKDGAPMATFGYCLIGLPFWIATVLGLFGFAENYHIGSEEGWSTLLPTAFLVVCVFIVWRRSKS